MKGWINLHRDITNHWIWHSPRHFRWWVLLLLMAQWEPRKVVFGKTSVLLQRGQICTTIRFLARQMDACSHTTITFLNCLEEAEMIHRISNSQMTIITITNYDKYQLNETIKKNRKERKVQQKMRQIKEDNKKEVKNNSSSISTHEDKNPFIQEIESSSDFLESVAQTLNCNIIQVRELFSEFVSEIKVIGKSHVDIVDFKKHFLNWTRKRIQNEENNKQHHNGTIENDKYATRKGNRIIAKKSEEYGESF